MRHSSPTRRSVRVTGLASALLLAAALAAPPAWGASPAPSAPGYPSWQDVQAALGNQAATQAEIATVQAALQTAQAEAATLSQQALDAAATADQAQADLDAATRREQLLAAQATAAASSAAASSRTVGRLAAQRYQDDDAGSLTLYLLGSPQPDELLSRLSVLAQVTTTWDGIAQGAAASASLATSLHDQATRAEAQRQRLDAAAQAAATAARTAATAAQAAVADAQQHTDTLYAQLATLQNTTAQVERQYEIGVQVAAQAAAEQRARAAAAQRSSSGASEYPSTDGVTVDPAAAQAYARGAIGGYGWGGGQFSCLISLWNMESGWRANALNASSGAYGIPQALPADKMAAAGADWRTNGDTQIDWGLAYIANRYGTPCGAWSHEMSENPHWY